MECFRTNVMLTEKNRKWACSCSPNCRPIRYVHQLLRKASFRRVVTHLSQNKHASNHRSNKIGICKLLHGLHAVLTWRQQISIKKMCEGKNNCSQHDNPQQGCLHAKLFRAEQIHSQFFGMLTLFLARKHGVVNSMKWSTIGVETNCWVEIAGAKCCHLLTRTFLCRMLDLSFQT